MGAGSVELLAKFSSSLPMPKAGFVVWRETFKVYKMVFNQCIFNLKSRCTKERKGCTGSLLILNVDNCSFLACSSSESLSTVCTERNSSL